MSEVRRRRRIRCGGECSFLFGRSSSSVGILGVKLKTEIPDSSYEPIRSLDLLIYLLD